MYQWVPQWGPRLLGNPSSKASDFFRAVFDAPEVGIIPRNVKKVTIMLRKVYESEMLKDLFIILATYWKPNIKIWQFLLIFSFHCWWLRSLKVPFTSEISNFRKIFANRKRSLPWRYAQDLSICWRNQDVSQKMHSINMTTFSCETTKHLWAAVCTMRCILLSASTVQWDAFYCQLLPYNEMHSIVSFYWWCFSCTTHGINLAVVRYLPSTQEKRIGDFYTGTKCSAFWIICQGVSGLKFARNPRHDRYLQDALIVFLTWPFTCCAVISKTCFPFMVNFVLTW